MGAKKCVCSRKMKRLAASFVPTRPRARLAIGQSVEGRPQESAVSAAAVFSIDSKQHIARRSVGLEGHAPDGSFRCDASRVGELNRCARGRWISGHRAGRLCLGKTTGDVESVARLLKHFPAVRKARDTRGTRFKGLAREFACPGIRQWRNPKVYAMESLGRRRRFRSIPLCRSCRRGCRRCPESDRQTDNLPRNIRSRRHRHRSS
jgi:hypothetical protein